MKRFIKEILIDRIGAGLFFLLVLPAMMIAAIIRDAMDGDSPAKMWVDRRNGTN